MHTRAEPKVKGFPHYDDVVDDMVSFLERAMAEAMRLGVAEESIILDPGPDFAKTPAETVMVLRAVDRLVLLGRPVLLAVSRKDFIGAINLQRPLARLAGTLAAIGDGLDRGGAILRVHDVREVADYLRVRAALRGDTPVPADLHLPVELRREPST
jgi:dihydropteroate synthase